MTKEKEILGLREDKQVLSVKRSFSQTLKEVEARIEWCCLGRDRQARGRELAMIIAEVERLAPDAQIRIDGDDKDASDVAEVYKMLTHDHINAVLDQLDEVGYRVKAMKTYLRTALYNVVFTMENSIDNSVKSDF